MVIFVTLALVGFVFLAVSSLLGGHHDFAHDHEVSFEHDHDHDHGGTEASHGPSPFSIRIIALFVTAFGAVGAIVRYCGANYPLSSLAGVMGGVIFGWVGLYLMQLFWRQQASSTIKENELVGLSGQVTTSIPRGGIGQISLVVKEQRQYKMARSKNDADIPEGKTVKIIEAGGGYCVVQLI